MLGQEPGDVSFVDWAHSGTAAPWLNVALLMADVVASGASTESGGEIEIVATFTNTCPGIDTEIVVALTASLAAVMHSKAREGVISARPHGH